MTDSPQDADEISIDELVGRSGIPASTLRFYEREELIRSRRSPEGRRRYPRETVRKVAFIRASRSVGVPLETIRAFLAMLPEGETPTARDLARVSACWNSMLVEQIGELKRPRESSDSRAGSGYPPEAPSAEGDGVGNGRDGPLAFHEVFR